MLWIGVAVTSVAHVHIYIEFNITCGILVL